MQQELTNASQLWRFEPGQQDAHPEIGVRRPAGTAAGEVFAIGERCMLLLDGVHDIVIRQLRFHPVLDHFPGWDPEDGPQGAWNSDYDTVSLRRSHHVWVDHCSFGTAGIARPLRLGRPFEQTDGLLDITRMSDLVTVSWCPFATTTRPCSSAAATARPRTPAACA